MTEESLDEFFDDMFVELGKIDFEGHPSEKTLQDYLRGNLAEESKLQFFYQQAFANFMRGEIADWKLSEVSLHVATCKTCAIKIAQLRSAELAQVKKARSKTKERIIAFDLSHRFAVDFPLITSAAATLLILLLGLFAHFSHNPDLLSPGTNTEINTTSYTAPAIAVRLDPGNVKSPDPNLIDFTKLPGLPPGLYPN